MVTPELITYIRQQRADGVLQEKIAQTLTQHGWSSKDIAEAFLSISAPKPISLSGQKATPASSFLGRKIVLSSGLIIASGLYVFFQYTANIPRTSAIATSVPLPNKNMPSGSPVAKVSSLTSTPTVVVQTPTPAPIPKGKYADGTYTGRSANAYYGMVQVSAVIQNGALADVKILQYPNDRNTSIRINSQALPILRQEAIRAQSAKIDAVSGASDTSPAFIASLSSALALAKN